MMKKALRVFVAAWVVLGLSLASQAVVVYGLDQTGLTGLTKYGEDPAGQTLAYIAVDPDAVYGPMIGDVGFMGTLLDLSLPISSSIMIGTGSEDLTGYDEFSMTLSNDNDDTWTVELYVDAGGSVTYSATATLAPFQTETLTLSVAGLGVVDSVGFVIGADRNDTYHISAVAIPEPTTMCLLALGGLLLRRRKSA